MFVSKLTCRYPPTSFKEGKYRLHVCASSSIMVTAAWRFDCPVFHILTQFNQACDMLFHLHPYHSLTRRWINVEHFAMHCKLTCTKPGLCSLGTKCKKNSELLPEPIRNTCFCFLLRNVFPRCALMNTIQVLMRCQGERTRVGTIFASNVPPIREDHRDTPPPVISLLLSSPHPSTSIYLIPSSTFPEKRKRTTTLLIRSETQFFCSHTPIFIALKSLLFHYWDIVEVSVILLSL